MSKSKEEILNEAHWKYVREKGISSIHTELFPGAYKEQAEIAMDQFAKSQCIAFHKFVKDNYHYIVIFGGRYMVQYKFEEGTPWPDLEKMQTWSLEELYDLFIQNQNNQK